MKKIFGIIIVISFFLLTFLVLGYFTIKNNDPFNKITDIKISETLVKNEDDYYVYFYMKNCPDCIKVENYFLEFAQNNKVYKVNFEKVNNKYFKYNWSELYEKYDIEIGELEDSGNINKISTSIHLSNAKNIYGKKMYYKIITADESYVLENKNAVIGKIYATTLTPEIDYSKVKDWKDIIIPGVPELLHIKNNKIVDFYFDSPELMDFFKGQ